jgi:hypothetical protein
MFLCYSLLAGGFLQVNGVGRAVVARLFFNTQADSVCGVLSSAGGGLAGCRR